MGGGWADCSVVKQNSIELLFRFHEKGGFSRQSQVVLCALPGEFDSTANNNSWNRNLRLPVEFVSGSGVGSRISLSRKHICVSQKSTVL